MGLIVHSVMTQLLYEWVHCVSMGRTVPLNAHNCMWIIYSSQSFIYPHLKQILKNNASQKPLPHSFAQSLKWIMNGSFFSFFCKQGLDFSQLLLRKPIETIDWALSLKRRFASANLLLFVLFGTSSSPTRQWQLSESERGPQECRAMAAWTAQSNTCLSQGLTGLHPLMMEGIIQSEIKDIMWNYYCF